LKLTPLNTTTQAFCHAIRVATHAVPNNSKDHIDLQLQGQAVKKEQLAWLFFWDLLTVNMKGTTLI
jgi:hypothetical protein